MPSPLEMLARAVVCVEEARRIAREEDRDLAQENAACQFADEARRLLDGLRLCSECHRASGNGTDVCDECWPVYQARLEQEDREEEFRELETALEGWDDEEDDDLEDLGYEDEDDGFDEGAELEEWAEDMSARDWEGEALALREAQLDATVDPFGMTLEEEREWLEGRDSEA